MRLVEASLLADSIESAAVVQLSMRLAESEDIVASTHLVRQAAECELASALENASKRLQGLAIDETGFSQLARACEPLADLLRYGSVRKLDFSSLGPLVGQLFLRATLGIRNACQCDDASARDGIKPAIIKLHDLTVFLPELVDGPAG